MVETQNTNNTERDGWEIVTINDYQYRFRMDPEYGFEAQEDNGNGSWYDCYADAWHYLRLLHTERTAARDRDAALAELVAKWKAKTRTLYGLSPAEARQFLDELEALLTNPTAHAEADRQGDIAKQMYETLKEIAKGACTEYRCYDTRCRPGRLAKVAVEAYEALHGAEGVR